MILWVRSSAVVPEELQPEAAALAQAEAKADAQAGDPDHAGDANEGLVDPASEGAFSSFVGICARVEKPAR